MKPALLFHAICLAAFSIQAADRFVPPASPRAEYDFNPGWRLFVGDDTNAASATFDDLTWKAVTLPHAWNEDAAFRVPIDQHPTGIAWYRKHFTLPSNMADEKVFLEFEGIRQAGEFYLNGKFIGRHENGVMAFGFDISDAVKRDGENVLAARIDNRWDYREKATNTRFQWADRNFNANFGGIPKNVKLHLTGKLYQTLPLYSQLGTAGAYIYAQDFDIAGHAATVTTETQVKNELAEAQNVTCSVAIVGPDGKLVKTFAGESAALASGETATLKASARVGGLQFWSWGYGYLYDVYTILRVGGKVVDVQRTRTGFRKTEFADGTIRLNDRVIQVHGYAQRTSNEWPALGDAVPAWLSDFSNGLIVEGNGNLVRWMHITPFKQDVESCDRVGLMEAMPAGDSEKDAEGRQWQQRVELMRDAIIYNRNNPSIIFYEGGNNGISETHMRELKAIRDEFDPHGGRAIGARDMLDSTVAEYGGEMLYINKSAGKPMWAMEYSRDEALRKYWDDLTPPFHQDGDGPLHRNAPAREYNRNQDSFAIEDVTRWHDYWEQRPGTGARVNSGGVNIIFSDSNTHYRGAENYRRSGEVDALRIPKDAFYANQVMWDGWVDVEHPRIHIIGHWNYADGVKKDVSVVSGADRVELFLNGKPLGFGAQTNRFLFTFKDVVWQPGELKAKGFDANEKLVCETTLTTAGKAVALRLKPIVSPNGWRADGADVALVQVETVDTQGRRCPTNFNLVNFSLTGPAEWRGGLAQGPENYILAKSLPVECGVNRVILRSTPQTGTITLTATSAGLKPATLELATRAFLVTNGLAATLPGTDLPANLRRGPTPATPSFHVSRIAIPVAGATAGTDGTNVMKSFDDNERTSWASRGSVTNAWIRYEFARPATPAEVVLKLASWRERSYPLRVTVDGAEVWRGVTPRSLGYVTLPLKPVSGRTLQIELTGAAGVATNLNVNEVENQQNAATGDPRAARTTFNIVEFECYEKPGK